MTAQESYFEYLKGRSRLGFFYRQHWLYPRLCQHLAGKTLDVGCGIGDFLRYRPDSTGVDINPATVDWCTRQGLDARLMTPNTLPFEAGSFDSAMLDNVLEHLDDPAPLLREIHRVLRAGAPLVVGVPGRRGFAADPDHKVFYDEKLLDSTLTAAGFHPRQMFHMPVRSGWLDAHARQYCRYGVFQRV